MPGCARVMERAGLHVDALGAAKEGGMRDGHAGIRIA